MKYVVLQGVLRFNLTSEREREGCVGGVNFPHLVEHSLFCHESLVEFFGNLPASLATFCKTKGIEMLFSDFLFGT